jgi:hypothetical protein
MIADRVRRRRVVGAGLAVGLTTLLDRAAAAFVLRLDDGQAAVLDGLAWPRRCAPAWRETVLRQAAAALPALTWQEPSADRHGRQGGQAWTADGTWLQERWLAAGLGCVDAGGLTPETAQALLRAEALARSDRLGLWRDDPVEPAARLASAPAGFTLVRGRVHAIAVRAREAYVNFADDWRTDFSLRAERAALRGFRRAGMDLEQLPGRDVVVRGWLYEANGPMIDLLQPLQLEVL